MTCNVGGADRVFRILGGLFVMAAGVYFRAWWGLVGLPLFLTGLFRWCPAYIPFGWNSSRKT